MNQRSHQKGQTTNLMTTKNLAVLLVSCCFIRLRVRRSNFNVKFQCKKVSKDTLFVILSEQCFILLRAFLAVWKNFFKTNCKVIMSKCMHPDSSCANFEEAFFSRCSFQVDFCSKGNCYPGIFSPSQDHRTSSQIIALNQKRIKLAQIKSTTA